MGPQQRESPGQARVARESFLKEEGLARKAHGGGKGAEGGRGDTEPGEGATEPCWEEGQVWDMALNVCGLKAMEGLPGQLPN